MRIGIETVDTTPEIRTYLGGFARMFDSKGVRDRLETTVVWFEDEDGSAAALVCADLVFIHRDLTERLRSAVRAKLGESVCIDVACSHSHATPYGTSAAPPRRFQRYADWWVEQATAAIESARARAVDGRLRWHQATHRAAINRRLPGTTGRVDFGWHESGPVDDAVTVVSLEDHEGCRLGLIVCAAVHPITLPPWSRRVSADWVGEMRCAVREKHPVPVAFVQGACADVNPRHEWVPRRFGPRDVRGPHAGGTNDEACEFIGRRVANAALDALRDGGDPIPTGPIGAARDRVAMHLRARRDAGGAHTDYWRALVDGRPMPRWVADALLNRAFPWSTPVEGGCVDLDVGVLRVGALAICSHGSEPFAETGLAVRRGAPTPFTIFAGYANGMIGYVPTDAAIPRGGYEVETVPALYRLPGDFAVGSEPAAVRATVRLAEALWGA